MGRRKPRKRIFLGSEGTSERNYGRYLKLIADKHDLSIHTDCDYVTGGGDPLKIVQESIKLIKRNSRNHGEYLVKAIMLDSDKLGRSPDRDDKIKPLVADGDIRLIYSRPNFEAFLLRHFPECVHKRPPASISLSELKKIWPSYAKGVDARSLYYKLGEDGLKRIVRVEDDLRDF